MEGRGLSYPAATVSAPREGSQICQPVCWSIKGLFKSFQYHKEVMESMNSQCRQLCRHPCETKLMRKYEAEEVKGQETPGVRGLSRSGGVKLLGNADHFPSLELCHLRCCLLSLSAALLAINNRLRAGVSVSENTTLSQTLLTKTQGEMQLHRLITVLYDPNTTEHLFS